MYYTSNVMCTILTICRILAFINYQLLVGQFTHVHSIWRDNSRIYIEFINYQVLVGRFTRIYGIY